MEREEVREQQVDARNSLWAPCPALTQPSPTTGPLTVAVRLGALRQCRGITDTWQPFDKAAPLNKHLELNGPGLQGWAGTLSFNLIGQTKKQRPSLRCVFELLVDFILFAVLGMELRPHLF